MRIRYLYFLWGNPDCSYVGLFNLLQSRIRTHLNQSRWNREDNGGTKEAPKGKFKVIGIFESSLFRGDLSASLTDVCKEPAALLNPRERRCSLG